MENEKKEQCVNCFHPIGTDTEISGHTDQKPRPNDLTICLYCGQPYWYDGDLKKIPITQKQFRGMPMSEKKIIQDAWAIRAELLQVLNKPKK
jgi:hypothetical protein